MNVAGFAVTSLLLVGIPAALWSLLIWLTSAIERPRPNARGQSSWKIGLLAAPLGLLASAAWLTWTAADHAGNLRGPQLPAPSSFPQWQIVACGATLVIVACAVSLLARRVFAGALASALGTAAGLGLAFNVDIAFHKVTSQEGIGTAIVMIFGTAGLMLATGLFALARHLIAGRNRTTTP